MKIYQARKNFDPEKIKETIAFIVGKQGLLKRITSPIFSTVRPITPSEWKSQVGEQYIEVPEITYISMPKVDDETYKIVLKFLQKVFEIHGGEGCVLLALDRNKKSEDQKYTIIIPNQIVTSAHVDYNKGMEEANKELKELPGNFYLAGTIHSHPNFGAYQSSVDSKDEDTFDGMHITLGQINQANNIDYHQRFVVCKSNRTMEDDYCPRFQLEKGEDIKIPDGWLEKVSAPFRHEKTTRNGNWDISSILQNIEIIRYNLLSDIELIPMFQETK